MSRPAPQARELPIKGFTIPSGHPRSTFTDPIDISRPIDPKYGPRRSDDDIVVHVHKRHVKDSIMNYTGVYSVVNNFGQYQYHRNPDLTNKFLKEVGRRPQSLDVKMKGYNFQLSRNSKRHTIVSMQNKAETYGWYLYDDGGNIRYVNVTPARMTDKAFWKDPDAYRYLDSNDIHSGWYDMDGSSSSLLSMGMSPLETVKKVLLMRDGFSLPRNITIPDKYSRALDFSRWNRNFVLHVDPRTCQLPLDLIDSKVMGVYTPINGKVLNGYPVWERKSILTTSLSNAMGLPVKTYLEDQGIHLPPPNDNPQYLYIEDKLDGNKDSGSLLVATERLDIKGVRKSHSCHFVGGSVSEDIDTLLSDPTSLFTNPDKAFVTAHFQYRGYWVAMYVAFTPEEYFREAINLAALEVNESAVNDFLNNNTTAASSQKKKKNKKKKKKKKKNGGQTDESNKQKEKVTTNESTTANAQSSEIPKAATKNSSATTTSSSDAMEETDHVDQIKIDTAHVILRHLSKLIGMDSVEGLTLTPDDHSGFDWAVTETLEMLFDNDGESWLLLDDTTTSKVLEAALSSSSSECKDWFTSRTNDMIIMFSEEKRYHDLTVLLDSGVDVSAEIVCTLFSHLPRERGAQFNNMIAKVLCSKCTIFVESKDDFSNVNAVIYDRVGKAGKKDILVAMKKASATFQKSKKQQNDNNTKSKKQEETETHTDKQTNNSNEADTGSVVNKRSTAPMKQPDLKESASTIQESLQWYRQKLDSLVSAVSSKFDRAVIENKVDNISNNLMEEEKVNIARPTQPKKHILTSEQVVTALSSCESDAMLLDVETKIGTLVIISCLSLVSHSTNTMYILHTIT